MVYVSFKSDQEEDVYILFNSHGAISQTLVGSLKRFVDT